ncbi:MAG TPA: hypothetical protein VKM69_08180 [Natronoarchaeum rubrum]|nr:hypothetical protein [Natronoarchaeum rubrum]
MDTGALRSYVDRSRELVATSPELSERNTQIRLVQPFLTALGWELHQIAADRDVPTPEGSATVDFALLVADDPAVLVETSACGADLEREQAERLGRTLLASGVDRGILTNGREFAFVAVDGSDGAAPSLDRFECRLAELSEHADDVSHYAREAVEQSVRNGRRQRREAADALDADREIVIADVHDRLVATAGDDVADRLRAESERFVEDLIASLRGDEPEEERDGGSDADEDRDAGATAADESATEHDAETRPESNAGNEPAVDAEAGTARSAETVLDDESERALEAVAGTASDDGSAPEPAEAEHERAATGADVPANALGAAVAEDGQYVVRLFGGRTSVWAVGHARAAMTTAQAIEYLLERGAADGRDAPADEVTGSVSPPWGPEGDHAVLREDAVANATIELSNGWHLDARVPVGVAKAAIDRLAERAGLRAMFQDEWAAE